MKSKLWVGISAVLLLLCPQVFAEIQEKEQKLNLKFSITNKSERSVNYNVKLYRNGHEVINHRPYGYPNYDDLKKIGQSVFSMMKGTVAVEYSAGYEPVLKDISSSKGICIAQGFTFPVSLDQGDEFYIKDGKKWSDKKCYVTLKKKK